MGTKHVNNTFKKLSVPALTENDTTVDVRVANESLRAAIADRCSAEQIATAIADAMHATKMFHSRSTGVLEIPDHDIRLKAVKLAAQLAYDAKLASESGETKITLIMDSLRGVLGSVELR
jgi:hypothetical protein